MEQITEGVNNISIADSSFKKNRIQVSNTKKPLFFYVNLAKRYMQQHNDVELSALGMGIIPEDGIPKSLSSNESLAPCDVAIFVYDREQKKIHAIATVVDGED